MNRLALATVLCLAFSLPLFGAQQRSFVSASGSDANNCTHDQPCRNFTAAVAQTNSGGEVVVLDSAGYGVFTIAQPVTIVAPIGVHAAISVFTATGVTVNAPLAEVVLRNLYINAQGGSTGIELQNASLLSIEHCVLNGFLGNGITLTPGNPSAITVSDTTVRDCGQSGLFVDGSTGANLSIMSSRFLRNSFGVAADRARIMMERSTCSNNFTDGILARGTGATISTPLEVVLDECVLAENGTGIDAQAGKVTVHGGSISGNYAYGVHGLGGNVIVDGSVVSGQTSAYGLATGAGGSLAVIRTTVTRNDVGVFLYSSLPALVQIIHSSIVQNDQGVKCDATFAIHSSGDNTIDGNATANMAGFCSMTPANTN